MRLAFLGLGNMGAAIAGNLIKAKHEVTVWNRTASRAQPLIEAGAILAPTARTAAAASDVIFTMVADDAALDAIVADDEGMLSGMHAGALHVSLSTIAVATADRLAVRHSESGTRFLSAPVFGRPEAAAAAKLFVVAAGAPPDLDTARPLLGAISQRIFEVGDKPSNANLVKLCGNFMILSAVEAMGEAMALAEKGGIPRAQLLDVLTSTLFDSPVYRNYGDMLAEQRYAPAGFAAPLGLKDMRLAGQSAEALGVPMPLLGVLRDHLLQTIAVEGAAADWSAIGLTIAKNAGLYRPADT